MEKWRTLLHSALECLESVEKIGIDTSWWALGGGASLILRYDHRLTNDVDVFLKDPQALPALSPRLNDRTMHLASDYEEGSSSLKLVLPDGEIDFVASPLLTDPAMEWRVIEGRRIQVETPLEVAAKKVFYRGVDFKPRDLIDLAFLLEAEPGFGEQLGPVVVGQLDLLDLRLRVLEATWPPPLGVVELKPPAEAVVTRAPAIVRTWIERQRALRR